MRIAAIQMASGSSISGNLHEAEKIISQAVVDGAEMIVLPENFGMIGAKQEDVVEFCEKPGEGALQSFLSEQAKRHNIIIAGGTVPLASEDSSLCRNTLLIYNQQGECVAHYDKIHLFDVSLPDVDESYNESADIQPGNKAVVVDIAGVKLGLAICYDLRFPELFRLLVDKGAEVILLPSAFTAATGKAHWHALLKARAIENLSFVIAPAQGGYHVNGRETYGHSLIVDPWGNVLDEIESGSGYAIADLNLAQQQQLREHFPVLSHRKFFVSETE